MNINNARGYDGGSSLRACRKDNGNDNKQDVFNPWMSYHGLVGGSTFSTINDKTLFATGIDGPIMIWQAPGVDDNKRLRLFEVCCFDFYLLFSCCHFVCAMFCYF